MDPADEERFQRRVSLGVGAFFGPFTVALALVNADALSEPATLAGLAVAAVVAAAFVSAGFDVDVSVAGLVLGWRQRAGIGYVVLGLAFGLSGPVGGRSVDSFSIVTLLGGIGFAAFGVLTYFEHDSLGADEEPSMRQVATTLIAISVLAIGGALVFVFFG